MNRLYEKVKEILSIIFWVIIFFIVFAIIIGLGVKLTSVDTFMNSYMGFVMYVIPLFCLMIFLFTLYANYKEGEYKNFIDSTSKIKNRLSIIQSLNNIQKSLFIIGTMSFIYFLSKYDTWSLWRYYNDIIFSFVLLLGSGLGIILFREKN